MIDWTYGLNFDEVWNVDKAFSEYEFLSIKYKWSGHDKSLRNISEKKLF